MKSSVLLKSANGQRRVPVSSFTAGDEKFVYEMVTPVCRVIRQISNSVRRQSVDRIFPRGRLRFFTSSLDLKYAYILFRSFVIMCIRDEQYLYRVNFASCKD